MAFGICIPLADYVEVLRFRESELRRVLAAYKAAGQSDFHDANKWQWPPDRDVHWSGPVVHGYLWNAERTLMETQLAIRHYQGGIDTKSINLKTAKIRA